MTFVNCENECNLKTQVREVVVLLQKHVMMIEHCIIIILWTLVISNSSRPDGIKNHINDCHIRTGPNSAADYLINQCYTTSQIFLRVLLLKRWMLDFVTNTINLNAGLHSNLIWFWFSTLYSQCHSKSSRKVLMFKDLFNFTTYTITLRTVPHIRMK